MDSLQRIVLGYTIGKLHNDNFLQFPNFARGGHESLE